MIKDNGEKLERPVKPIKPEWFPKDLYIRLDSFEKGWFKECLNALEEIYQTNPKAREEIPAFIRKVEIYYHSNLIRKNGDYSWE